MMNEAVALQSVENIVEFEFQDMRNCTYEEHQKGCDMIRKKYMGLESVDKKVWRAMDRELCDYFSESPSEREEVVYDVLMYLGVNMYERRLRNLLSNFKKDNELLNRDLSERVRNLEEEGGLKERVRELREEVRGYGLKIRGGENLLSRYDEHMSSIEREIDEIKKSGVPGTDARVYSLNEDKAEIQDKRERTFEAQQDYSLELTRKYHDYKDALREMKKAKVEIRKTKERLSKSESRVLLLEGYFDKKNSMMNSRKLCNRLREMDTNIQNMDRALRSVDDRYSREMEVLGSLDENEGYDSSELTVKIEDLSSEDSQKKMGEIEEILQELGI